MSGVVTFTSVKIAGLLGLSSPRAYTSVIQVASVKLSRLDMSLIMQAKFSMSGEGSI